MFRLWHLYLLTLSLLQDCCIRLNYRELHKQCLCGVLTKSGCVSNRNQNQNHYTFIVPQTGKCLCYVSKRTVVL